MRQFQPKYTELRSNTQHLILNIFVTQPASKCLNKTPPFRRPETAKTEPNAKQSIKINA